MKVRLITATEKGENLIAYMARVSNPENQTNPDYEKLFKFCIRNGHWSIFEMAHMVVEIKTSRAIAQQILRHRSFTYQEFSQRYSKVISCEQYPARRQDIKNRQNSVDDLPEETKKWFKTIQEEGNQEAIKYYNEALDKGIAKEQARFLLPLSTSTTLYMNGTVRSWIHYLNLRSGNGTQKEHMDIANEIKKIFSSRFPIVAAALNYT